MRYVRRTMIGRTSLVLVSALLVASCSNPDSAPGDTAPAADPPVAVTADPSAPVFVASVVLTDDGPEPEYLFLPAGRPIRLGIRGGSTMEHHYRVVGLVPAQLRWFEEPQYTLFELENLSPEQQAAVGFDPAESIENHTEHHLTARFSPTKPASPSGIQPLGTEVHGYTDGYATDLLTFFALSPGEYEVMDALHPDEPRGTVVVFAPNPTSSSTNG